MAKTDLAQVANNTNKIAQGTTVKGDILSSQPCRIDGTVEGMIQVGNRVVVGGSGLVKGNIEAEELLVSGKIEGNVHCKKLTSIEESAIIKGDITAAQLEVKVGAVINGTCVISNTSLEKNKKVEG